MIESFMVHCTTICNHRSIRAESIPREKEKLPPYLLKLEKNSLTSLRYNFIRPANKLEGKRNIKLISLRFESFIIFFSRLNRRLHFSKKDKRRTKNGNLIHAQGRVFTFARDRGKSGSIRSDTDRSEAATEGSAFFRVQRASLRRLDPWPTSFVSLHDRFAAVNRQRNLRCDHRSLHANGGEGGGGGNPLDVFNLLPLPSFRLSLPSPLPKTVHSRGSETINEIDDIFPTYLRN